MPCDIIIPVFNQKQYTQSCLESIKRHTHTDYRIIIVDDNSSDAETVKFLDAVKNDNIKVIRNEQNLGWVKSVNRGLAESSAEYVCIMNNDTLVADGWFSEMIAVAEKEPDIGLVNPVWEKPDRISIEDYARGLKKYAGQFIETDWARGFCFLVKRKVIDKIGGLDEAYSPGYSDDWDFSVRAIRAGFRCIRSKAAYVYHYRNKTHKGAFEQSLWDNLIKKNNELFYQRWGKPLRIVFIFSGKTCDKKKIEDMLFSLARQQHHIYIWAINKYMPHIAHTNVEVSFIPRFLFYLFVLASLINNFYRNIDKRYNALFMGDSYFLNLFSVFGITRKTHIFLTDFNDATVCERIQKHIGEVKASKKKEI
ncbi:MAG: glycosyltransferase family 2 protein [Candidatus Omnitrophota bacterium]|nr:glycosyltransferase family 2 protein [Candidatus Omnitrophota bacterium]